MFYCIRGFIACLAVLPFLINPAVCLEDKVALGATCSIGHAHEEHIPPSLIQTSSSMGLNKMHGETRVREPSQSDEPGEAQVREPSNLMNLLLTAKDKANNTELDGTGFHGVELLTSLTHDSEFAARPVAAMMISAAAIIIVIFGMAHARNDRLANMTFIAVDNFIAVFVAVLWFQAVHTDVMLLTGIHTKILASCIHAICTLVFMVALLWLVSKRPALLATVASCGGYIIAFAAMHAGFMSQKYNFSQHWLQTVIGIAMLMMAVFILAVGFHFVWKGLFHEKGVKSEQQHVNAWAENAENMENDFGAMPIAVAVIELVHFLLDGEFPEVRGTNMHHWHTHEPRMQFLAFSIFLLALTCFAVPFLKRMQEQPRRPYPQRRTLGFLSSLLAMCTAWAFIDWGQWQMYEEFQQNPIFARIIYADVCTALGLFALCFLTLPGFAKMSWSSTDVAIRSLSLVVAWSWEQAFDATLEHTMQKELTKPLIAMLVALVLVPFMVVYTKPTVLSIKKLSN